MTTRTLPRTHADRPQMVLTSSLDYEVRLEHLLTTTDHALCWHEHTFRDFDGSHDSVTCLEPAVTVITYLDLEPMHPLGEGIQVFMACRYHSHEATEQAVAEPTIEIMRAVTFLEPVSVDFTGDDMDEVTA